mmetsp:Transcript_41071/g.131372  ORF Transcript_41071/g.131372 Transcript_41071/m.131372 type:complete len:165 (+) Transcript_41071:1511-2005(+)
MPSTTATVCVTSAAAFCAGWFAYKHYSKAVAKKFATVLSSSALADQNADYKMALVVRADLKMGKGKIAAQCSHATLGLYKKLWRRREPALKRWEEVGQAKVVLKVDTEQELLEISQKLKAAGIPTHTTIDAGRTQIAPNSRTVMAIGPATVDEINKFTGHLKLL